MPKSETSSIDEDIRKVGSRMIRVQSLNMFGVYSESADRQYLLIRQDSDRESGVGGCRDSGNGRFALARQGKILYVGECERPTEGAVSNSGTFAIIDTLFGDKLGSKLYVYSEDGKLLFSKRFTANTLNMGISTEGSHVVVQLCGSNTKDSGKLLVFEISTSETISAFAPETRWAQRYEFSVSDQIVYLCYDNNRRYAYSFQGVFLDGLKYARDQIEDASPADLVLIVREKLKDAPQEKLPELLSMINKAFEGDLSQYDEYLALAYRLKGEINELLGNLEDAVFSYKKALEIDPKIGVKQRLNKLEKRLGKKVE